MSTLAILALTAIVITLIFDYTNGFHDASNIIATVIASRALTPVQAVVVVAFFEFMGPLLGGTAVANTIGKFVDISDVPKVLAVSIMVFGIWGAIFWNLLTWYFGIPSSSSHALVGGFAGVVIIAAGADHVVWGFAEFFATGKMNGVTKVLASLLVSPLLGFWVGFAIHRIVSRQLRRAKPSANKYLRRFQWVSSAILAFSHGANDAQKSMGMITLVLLLTGWIDKFVVPFWVMLSCAIAIVLGILSGGWSIVRTIGFGIFKVRPIHAFNGQLTSGLLILGASSLGAPVSTTHVVSSALVGIGAAERPKAVRWAKAREIVSTWIITIPASGATAALTFYLVNLAVGGIGT